MRWSGYVHILFFLVITACLGGGDRAQAAVIRAASHGAFGRIVFDWDESVRYSVQTTGNLVTLTFSQPVQDDPSRVPHLLKDFVSAASLSDDRKTVSLTLSVEAGARSFPLGTSVVVDLVKGAKAVDTAPLEGGTGSLPPRTPPGPPSQKGSSGSVPSAQAPPETGSAGAASAAVPSEATSGSGSGGGGSGAESGPVSVGAPSEGGAVESPASVPEAVSSSSQGAPLSGMTVSASQSPLPTAASPEASLSFSWNEQTGAAVFQRAGWFWIVFDRPSQADAERLARQGGDLVRHLEVLQSRDATILRLLIKPDHFPSLRREGLSWSVDLVRQPVRPAHSLDVRMETQSPVGPRIFISTPNPGRPLVLEDPEVGDRFIVVPLVTLGNGIFPGNSTPELELPVTAQGILVNVYSDRIMVNVEADGVDISGKGGLVLSPDIAAARMVADVGAQTNLKQVFDIESWMRGGEDQFLNNKQALQWAVAVAPADRRENARIDLARFMFAHGYEPETLGILRTIVKDRPAAADLAAVRALRGASNYLMGRYENAVWDLSHPSLEGMDDALFWLAAARAELSNPAEQAPFLKRYGSVLAHYPRRIRVPLALSAARSTVLVADDAATNVFLAAVRAEDNTPQELAAATYFRGQLAEATGVYDIAKKFYTEVLDSRDRRYPAMARRSLLELQYRLEEIDRSALIQGLEGLRFVWRGGSFEYNLLMRLGTLYGEQGEWDKALHIWQQAIVYFPDRKDSDGKTAAQHMQETYEKLYSEGGADKMSPIAAIALFDEFRELIPVGPKGDEMIRRLADRLVGVDLLPQAARLLERQVTYRLDGVERARVGARMGLIYLLDRHPDQAAEALLKTKAPGLPAALDAQRQQLMARALSDMDRPQEAIALLEQDTSRTADLLRAEIYWRAKQWQSAADVLEKLTVEPSQGDLTDSQARMILDRATALTLAQNEQAIVSLRQRYLPLMMKTAYKEAFDLLTSPTQNGLIDYRTVASRIKTVEEFQAFLQTYKDKLETGGLSAIN